MTLPAEVVAATASDFTYAAAWDAIGSRLSSPYLDNPAYSGAFDEFLALLPPSPAVLDLGCGPGVPVGARLVRAGARLTGVDFAAAMLRAAERNLPTARFFRHSLVDLPFVQDFDAFVACHSLLCLPPDSFVRAWRCAANALKQDGHFFVALNEGDAPGSGPSLARIQDHEVYARSYSVSEVQDAASGAGLVIDRLVRCRVTSADYGEEPVMIVIGRRDARW